MKSIADILVPLSEVQTINPKIFPKPNYSNVSPNIKVPEPIFIKFSDLYMCDTGNAGRADDDDLDPTHIADLQTSFGVGIRTNEEVGAVKDRGENSPVRYELKYSFHRTDALMGMGQEGHWYYPIEATDTEWDDICSIENEPQPPKKSNQERSIIATQVKQIKAGHLVKNPDVVKKRLLELYPTRPKASRDRIAQGIFELTDIKEKFCYWTDAKIKRWRENNYSGYFAMGGDWDRRAQMYGYTTKIGGLYRTFHRAEAKYAETGFTSYVNCFTGNVTKNANLVDQREAIIQEYINLRVQKYMVYKKDIKFLTLNGLFPQLNSEFQKGFKEFDQEEIEKAVKIHIKKALAKKNFEMVGVV